MHNLEIKVCSINSVKDGVSAYMKSYLTFDCIVHLFWQWVRAQPHTSSTVLPQANLLPNRFCLLPTPDKIPVKSPGKPVDRNR